MRTEQLKQFATDPTAFRASLVIDTDDGPMRLSEVMDDWQREDFRALDPGFMRAVGHRVEGGHSRAWLERGRGHSKTQDQAVMATWALAFAPRTIKGVAAANDREQARLMRDSIERLLRSNRWLEKAIEIYQYKVSNRHTGSELEIISADSHGAYGHLLDFLLVDEIGNWKRTSEPFWTALISTAGKRRNCMTVVISNAGFKQSWPYQVREAVRQDPNWYFHSLNGPVASWIGERQLSEQRRLLPHQQYARLWENVWSSGTGDGLNPAWVEDALRKPDGTPWLEGPMPERLTGRIAYAGELDCGWRSDHSALCIMAYHTADRRYELVDVKSWDPKDYGGELPLGIIRDACREAHRLATPLPIAGQFTFAQRGAAFAIQARFRRATADQTIGPGTSRSRKFCCFPLKPRKTV